MAKKKKEEETKTEDGLAAVLAHIRKQVESTRH